MLLQNGNPRRGRAAFLVSRMNNGSQASAVERREQRRCLTCGKSIRNRMKLCKPESILPRKFDFVKSGVELIGIEANAADELLMTFYQSSNFTIAPRVRRARIFLVDRKNNGI